MTTFYVDPVNGLDTNNGLGPDASAATNKPWKTIAKLVSATGMGSGDVGYLAPGTYREVTVTPTFSSNPTVETKIIGDGQNAQGFKDASGNPVPAGPVCWSAWTGGDTAVPSSSQMMSNPNTKNFLTWQYIWWLGGAGQLVGAGATGPHDWKFLDCVFMQAGNTSTNVCFGVTTGGATPLNLTFDRCLFWHGASSSIGISLTLTSVTTGADYDANVLVQNSVFIGPAQAISIAGGANTFKGGGVRVRNCTTFYGTMLATATVSGTSTSIPCTVTNCLIASHANPGVNAATSGQITEDYNSFYATAPRTNVTAGTHSISDLSRAPLFHIGQERLWGGFLRTLGEPMQGSPLLGFGNDGNQTSYDQRNNPRPAGGRSALPAVGALERSNTWGQETTTVRTGASAWSIIGPGYQDFLIPVDNTATTVSVYLRHDSTYAGTLPQLQVLASSELGVAAQTATQTAAANTWEQLSLTFTASKSGFVTVRVLSSDTNGAGKAIADDFAFA